MNLQVRLFAALRDRVGQETVTVRLADGASVAEALRALAEQHRPLAAPLSSSSVVMAVNRSYANAETVLADGDELALIPPVSGGAGPHARICAEELSQDRLTRLVASPKAGAIVVFQGVTREVERLDYEAYVEMAQEQMRQILQDALSGHEIEAAAAEHRIGPVPLGQPSVIVAVSAAHRDAAFAAAREVIDRIKAQAPIWKREIDGERAEWVPGTTPRPQADDA